MCTLTYLLNENGYEIFFNRDEQRARLPAILPTIDQTLNAIYPLDPQGQGTWLAVNQQGLTLALLNYYQAPLNTNHHIVSRGQVILSLLSSKQDILVQLNAMDLHVYQPFQLCVFPNNLSKASRTMYSVKWTGRELLLDDIGLPVTSSSLDFANVSQKRAQKFARLVDAHQPSSAQLKNYHFSTDAIGKHSVNMHREDAQTVSIAHISVNNTIRFNYLDNVLKQEHSVTFERVKALSTSENMR